MPFVAGQHLLAQDINALMLSDYLPADITVNNSTTLVTSGLSFSLDANAYYSFSGFLYFTSNPTADAKFSWTDTGSPTWRWSLYGPPTTTAPVVGAERQNYIENAAGFFTFTIGGDDTSTGTVFIGLRAAGFVATTALTTMTMTFAQNTADVSDTILKTGSWMRFSRMDA